MLPTLTQDLRLAARALRRSPGFTATATLTLAIGLGGMVAIIALVNGVLLRSLDFPQPGRLVAITSDEGASTSIGNFLDMARDATPVAQLAAYSDERLTLIGQGEAQSVAAISSVGLLNVLGTRPLLGRSLQPADEMYGAERVTVLSYSTWQSIFGGDRDIIGRHIVLNRSTVTVVGVMPSDFAFPDAGQQLWLPYQWSSAERVNRDQYFLSVIARLKDGVTIEQLRGRMAMSAAAFRRDYAQYNSTLRFTVEPLQEVMVGGARSRLYLFLGAVLCVLLITCANLANLQLARASLRRREIAVRRALGAGNRRIARQLLTESLLLTFAGGVAALAVGRMLLGWLVVTHRDILPRLENVRIDAPVVLCTIAMSVLAGLAIGSGPVLQLLAMRSSDALRENDRGGGVRLRARNALVISELALAVMLLVGAGLLVRSAIAASRVDPGFDPRNQLTWYMALGDSARSQLLTAMERVRAIPGVTSVAASSELPMSGRGIGAWFNILNRPVPSGTTPPAEAYRVVTANYFATVGIRLVKGRTLSDDDTRAHNPSLVVNEALANKYWPGRDPIGERVYLGAPDSRIVDSATIVGVVANTHDAGLRSDPVPEVFIPQTMLLRWGWLSFTARTSVAPEEIIPAVRKVMHDVAPTTPMLKVRTMEDIVRASSAGDRMALNLLSVLASVAVLMAALGVFGVLAYVVAQRRREIGIRMALGAERSAVRILVVRQGVTLAGVGVIIGLAGAAVLSGLLKSMVFGVRPGDPMTFAAVAVTLLGVALLASLVPAVRATRVDPVEALRE